MARGYSVEYPTEPSLFSPLQFLPRNLLQLAQSVKWQWFNRHVAGFHTLVHTHRVNWVIVGSHIQYAKPFTGHDADLFTIRVSDVKLRRDQSIMEISEDVVVGVETVATVRIVCMAMDLGNDDTLSSAAPGTVKGPLLERFQADEIDPSPIVRSLPPRVENAEASGTLLAEGVQEFRTWRHLCEIADQWCFVELPALCGQGREALVSEKRKVAPALRRGISQPMTSFDSELRKPYFFYDHGRIQTRAYEVGSEVVFVHRLLGKAGDDACRAIAVERFA